MFWIDELIVIVPLAFAVWIACYPQQHAKGVMDRLAAGHVAICHVISIGSLMQVSVPAIITLVAASGRQQTESRVVSRRNVTPLVGIAVSLTGFCSYLQRETRCFFRRRFMELRYAAEFFGLPQPLSVRRLRWCPMPSAQPSLQIPLSAVPAGRMK